MIKVTLPESERKKIERITKEVAKKARAKTIMAIENASVVGQASAVKAIMSQEADFTGFNRKSIKRTVNRRKLEAVVQATNSKYAAAVEFGFPANYVFPPSDRLVPWVRKKLGVPAKDAKGVAFLVARKIYERGRPAKPFMRPSMKKAFKVYRFELYKLLREI